MTDSGDRWSDNEVVELRRIFFAQAAEIIEELQESLLALEADAGDKDLLKQVKRSIHTLKGDANSVGLNQVGTLCHRMEDVLVRFERVNGAEGREAIDVLFTCIDAVRRVLDENEAGGDAGIEEEVLCRVDRFLAAGRNSPETPAHAEPPAVLSEYQELQIRDAEATGLHIYMLEAELHPQCGERSVAALMLVHRLRSIGTVVACEPDPESDAINDTRDVTVLIASGVDRDTIRRDAEITGITRRVTVHERTRSGASALQTRNSGGAVSAARSGMLRVDASRVDSVMDLVGEIIIGRSMLDQIRCDIEAGSDPAELAAKLRAATLYMERAVSDLQKSVMKMRMVPVYSVFRQFPRVVRELAAVRGRKIRVQFSGAETEMDKRIVDSLAEPLAHLVRNAVDHGIEPPGQRTSAGKPEEGIVSLKAYHEASRIVIEVADDGKGIDRDMLKRKAVEQGHLTRAEAEELSDAEALTLVFLPGLSTASTVSETSGRGVGMDAVKSVIEGLKGSIEMETVPGRGTLFRMRMPLTLAIINALLFEVGDRLYAVPVAVVSEVAKIGRGQIVTVEGRKTLLHRDRIISLVPLDELFPLAKAEKNTKYVLILATQDRKTGLVVDRIIGQQELVIKAVDDRHLQTDFVAGGSILGSGKVVLILDVFAILKKAIEAERKKELVAV